MRVGAYQLLVRYRVAILHLGNGDADCHGPKGPRNDRENLRAIPILPVILSERSESKNPYPFWEFEGMRVLRRAALAQDDRRRIGYPHFSVILSKAKNPFPNCQFSMDNCQFHIAPCNGRLKSLPYG